MATTSVLNIFVRAGVPCILSYGDRFYSGRTSNPKSLRPRRRRQWNDGTTMSNVVTQCPWLATSM